MDALVISVKGSSWIRGLPFLLALVLFVLPLSSTAKSISLGLALLAILMTKGFRSEFSRLLEKGWCKAALLLFALAILSSLWSPASYSERLFIIEKYSKLLYLPILVIGFREIKARTLGLNAFLASMFITSMLAILLAKGFLPFLNMNPDNLFRNHIMVGYMLDFAAFTTALFAWQQRGFKCLAYSLLFCLFSYHVLFVNAGRMGYLVYFLSMLLLVVQIFSWRKALLALIFLIASFIFIYNQNSFMKERIQLLQTQYARYQQHDGDNSVGFRLQFHAYAHELFNRHPLIGNGTSSFLYYFNKENPSPGWGHSLLEPHSQYWLIASEFGLVGLMALLAFYLTLLKASCNLDKMRPLALAMLLSLVVGNLSDSLLLYSGSGYFFILMMAVCLAEEDSLFKELRVKNQV
ncbi:MAG: O-antigen ligase family protein [Tatlockia sp.]|nr:O-antigen ligase family protein [Tatlockia sp.]